MSPSESQLRAALRDGEGQSLDVDAVVIGALRLRRERRRRLVSIAAAVVVVATVGVGGVRLLSGGDPTGGPEAAQRNSRPALGTVTGRQPVARSAPTGSDRTAGAAAPTATAGSAPARLAAGIACPAQLPRLAFAVGRQVESGGPLFSVAVAAVKVCAYPNLATTTAPGAASQVLSGADASDLAQTLEVAAKSRVGRMCPGALVGNGVRALALYAVTAAGGQLPVVTATISCPNTVTNGTAVRYDWSPPDSLTALLSAQRAQPIPTMMPGQS